MDHKKVFRKKKKKKTPRGKKSLEQLRGYQPKKETYNGTRKEDLVWGGGSHLHEGPGWPAGQRRSRKFWGKKGKGPAKTVEEWEKSCSGRLGRRKT